MRQNRSVLGIAVRLFRDVLLFTAFKRIGYKILSHRLYKIPSTAQPVYLHNLISVQPPGSTRSSSLITIARPPSSSSLKITDRSFHYASPTLWNNPQGAVAKVTGRIRKITGTWEG